MRCISDWSVVSEKNLYIWDKIYRGNRRTKMVNCYALSMIVNTSKPHKQEKTFAPLYDKGASKYGRRCSVRCWPAVAFANPLIACMIRG